MNALNCSAAQPPALPEELGREPRRDGARLAARARVKGAGADASPATLHAARPTAACPACRTSRRRPSGSSTCSSPARRRSWTCSTTSRICRTRRGIDLPDSVRMGQRITTMTSGQKSFPVAPSLFKFAQHGQSGAWLSELLAAHRRRSPTTSASSARCRPRRSTTTRRSRSCRPARSSRAGRAWASWVAYGLGSENQDLPAFVVLLSRGRTDQPLYDRLWGSGFLPTRYQGVKLRGGKEPVLYLANPAGCSRPTRRQMLDDIAALNDLHHDRDRRPGNPHPRRPVRAGLSHAGVGARADRPVERAADRSSTCTAPTCTSPAATPPTACWPAGWPSAASASSSSITWAGTSTATCPTQIRSQCRDTDQPSAALIKDLKQRGLLDDTLVIWGGEFGRTVYSQGQLTATNYGRDHHPRCFTIWLAGGGIKPGMTLGETDDFSYNIVRDPVEVYDLNATILHLLGIDHTRLTYKFQGRDFRLTDVHGKVVKAILA